MPNIISILNILSGMITYPAAFVSRQQTGREGTWYVKFFFSFFFPFCQTKLIIESSLKCLYGIELEQRQWCTILGIGVKFLHINWSIGKYFKSRPKEVFGPMESDGAHLGANRAMRRNVKSSNSSSKAVIQLFLQYILTFTDKK